jgi:hypothetical protein
MIFLCLPAFTASDGALFVLLRLDFTSAKTRQLAPGSRAMMSISPDLHL